MIRFARVLVAPIAACFACTVTVPFATVSIDAATDEAAVALDAGDAPRQPVPDLPGLAWTLVARPTTGSLRGLWIDPGGGVWATGQGGAVFRTDGTTWQRVETGVTGTLYALWGSSTVDVWAAGADAVDTTLLLHWNGTRWTRDTTVTDAYPVHALWGTDAADLWAVGGTIAAGLDQVLHWDGAQWLRVPMGQQYMEYLGIDGDARNDAVLVTSDNSIDVWDGSWDNGEERPGGGTLTGGVWVERHDVAWLTATGGSVLQHRGDDWSALIPTGALVTLHAICGNGPGDVWAVGDAGAMVHWDGRAWTRVRPLTTDSLWALRCVSPAEAWAVGDHGAVLHLGP